MNCQVCHKDIGDIVVLIPKRRPGGYLESLACLKCARESGMYCLTHQRPHLGYNDGTTVCGLCMGELFRKHAHRASVLVGMIQEAVPREDFLELQAEWAWVGASERERDQLMLTHLCSTSLGRKIDLDELVRRIVVHRSLDIIKLDKPPAA